MHWSLSPAQGVGRLAAQPQQAGGDGGQGEDHVRLGDVALAVLLHRHVHHLLVTTLPRLQAPAEAPGDVIREGEGNHLDKGANVNTSLLIDASPGIQRGPDLSNGKQYYRQQSASTLGAGITKQKNELFVVDNPNVCQYFNMSRVSSDNLDTGGDGFSAPFLVLRAVKVVASRLFNVVLIHI